MTAVSCSIFSYQRSIIHLIVDRIRVDRVLSGSDYPADIGQPDPVNWIRNTPNLSSEEKISILSDNSERLFASSAKELA
jgi:aminocarboxymuconate-semialdehyde decarboxylase